MEGCYSEGASREVEFKCEEISIDINVEEVTTESGWTLLPLNPPVVIINCVVFSPYVYPNYLFQIYKSSVDSYSPEEGVATSCQISIWSEDSGVKRLHYRMILKGIKSEHNYLIIKSPTSCTGECK